MMDTIRANKILDLVHYPQYKLTVTTDGRGEMYLQGSYIEADIFTGKEEIQKTRRWFISPEMSTSELVQTAFKCIITSAEHRVREHFKYKGELVFGPHFNVEDLYNLAKVAKLDQRKK